MTDFQFYLLLSAIYVSGSLPRELKVGGLVMGMLCAAVALGYSLGVIS